MLLIFALSVTPKKYFHDIFSHHGDELFQINNSGEKQIENHKFNCGFVNSITLTPFIEPGCIIECNTCEYNNYLVTKTVQPVFVAAIYRFLLRGPPVA